MTLPNYPSNGDSRPADIRAYLEMLYGAGTGYCHVVYGRDWYRNDAGKLTHATWSERIGDRHAFGYPEQADAIVAKILQLDATGADVYVASTLMRDGLSRREDNVADRWCLHADADNGCLAPGDLATIAEWGWCAVASGTPGNYHIFIPLAAAVSDAQYRALQHALVELLKADAKKAANDVLRSVETRNYKATVDGGVPHPVGWAVPFSGVRLDPRAVAELLHVDLLARRRPPNDKRQRQADADRPSTPKYRQPTGFRTGLKAIQEAVERAHAPSRQVNHPVDPVRRIDTHLLPRIIAPHVAKTITTPTWAEDEAQDQRKLFKKVFEVGASLAVWGGGSPEEILDVLRDYRPSGRALNVLWEELTHRGYRERWPEDLALKALKFAAEEVGDGYIRDVDQPASVEARIGRYTPLLGALRGTDAKVAAHVMSQMRARGYLNVTCPAEKTAEDLGLATPMTAWRSLRRLTERGVLQCLDRGGRPREDDPTKLTAAVYTLPPMPTGAVSLRPAGAGRGRKRAARNEDTAGHIHGAETTINDTNTAGQPGGGRAEDPGRRAEPEH